MPGAGASVKRLRHPSALAPAASTIQRGRTGAKTLDNGAAAAGVLHLVPRATSPFRQGGRLRRGWRPLCSRLVDDYAEVWSTGIFAPQRLYHPRDHPGLTSNRWLARP